jgi:peptide deformylase
MELLYYPNAWLDKKLPEFDFNNPVVDPEELKTEMLNIMYDNDGVGLSASQVGVDTQAFVMGSKHAKDKSQIFFNPRVVEVSKETTLEYEGCLSFPGIFMKVNRPSWVHAQFQNEKGELQEGKILDYDARCYLHELDHLMGITFKDRVSKMKWDMAVKKAKKKGLVK